MYFCSQLVAWWDGIDAKRMDYGKRRQIRKLMQGKYNIIKLQTVFKQLLHVSV